MRKEPSLEFLALTLLIAAFSAGYLIKIHKEKINFTGKISGHAYKINDQLHLAVLPLEESETPTNKEYLKKRFPNPRTLDFLLGGIYFFTPGNKEFKTSKPQKNLVYDENIAHIVSITPWNTEMHATRPDAAKDARIHWKKFKIRNSPQTAEHYLGMECYSHPGSKEIWSRKECLAERAPGEWAIFEILTDGEYGAPYPTISTRYFTPKYGGLTVHWESNSKNAHQWKSIDEKMWKLIDSWNIAD